MTDTIVLKQIIHDRGLKLGYIADKMGITYPTLQRLLDGEAEFKASQINLMCDILGITDVMQMTSIFFASNVEKSST